MDKDSLPTTEEEKRRVLLVEYEKAQDSAEHHERLGWQSKSILWAASVILLGYSGTPSISKWPVLVFTFAGIILLWFPRPWNEKLAVIKRLKYTRCVEIEKLLGMQQHTRTQEDAPRGQLKKLATRLAWLLTIAWIARLVMAWFPTIRAWIC